ncbi:MAG: glycosyltransferase family 2 protein [Thermoleophilia bacterium]|nr:glycosyltransferase family 2 protein [Thermoleophilia bacterium]
MRDALDLPGMARRHRVPGSVWAVGMVKNESDIIASVVEHLVRQGVDGLLIADNLSSDETEVILEGLAERHPVYIARDREQGYFQDIKMTLLSRWARRAGADWIVPFDADEFWFAPESTLADYLRSCGADVVTAEMHNLFPVAGVEFNEGLWRLEVSPHGLKKVAFRSHRYAFLDTGNHSVLRPGLLSAGLRIVHVPWRSYEQFRRKGQEGSQALSAAGLDPSTGSQWRAIGSHGDEGARDTWAHILAGDPVEGICWSPGRPTKLVDPLAWPTWDPDGVLC